MTPAIDISIESKQLFAAMDIYAKALGVDSRTALKRRFRILIQRIMSWTPPYNRKGSNMADAEKIGKAAIRRDILRVGRIVKQEVLDFWLSDNNGSTFIADKTFNESGTIKQYHVRNTHLDQSGAILESRHRAARDRRGRVPARKGRERVAVSAEVGGNYIKKMQARSGKAKAGWLAALEGLGGSAQPWISRHGNGDGRLVDLMSGNEAILTAINTAKGIGSLQRRIIKSSIRAETKALIREMNGATKSAAKRARLIRDNS